MKIKGIESVFLHVSDLHRAARFYEEILGLEPGARSDSAVEFRLGDDRIGILHTDTQVATFQDPDGNVLHLVEKGDSAVKS